MKETRSVQVYPDNNVVNSKIQTWNCFGWELLSNQRQQEERGGTIYTFVILTFQREKNEPWYAEVSKIEKEYDELNAAYVRLEEQAPVEKGVLGKVFGIFGGNKKAAAAEQLRQAEMKSLVEKMTKLIEKAEAIVNGRA